MSNEFTCVICGQQVSKRQSLAYKDGRACRSHEEVNIALAKKEDEEAAKKQREKEAEENRKKRHEPKQFSPNPKCLCCHAEGITRQQFYFAMLVGMERGKDTPGFNFLNPAELIKHSGLPDGTKILLPYEPTDRILGYLRTIDREIAGLLGQVILCADCAKHIGLDPEKRMEELNPTKNMTMEAITHVGVAYETSGMKEKVQNAAALIDAIQQQ